MCDTVVHEVVEVLPRDLKLGDHVKLFDHPFCWSVVRQIKDGQVHLFRPYVHLADFEYTGGVIPYIGIEEFTIHVDDSRPVHVWPAARPDLR